MKKLITKLVEGGICKIDVNEVIKSWTDKFSISQYCEEFSFVKNTTRKGEYYSVRISKEQADEVIKTLNLFAIEDTIFKNSKTFRKRDFIEKELMRISKIVEQKTTELNIMKNIAATYRKALYV